MKKISVFSNNTDQFRLFLCLIKLIVSLQNQFATFQSVPFLLLLLEQLLAVLWLDELPTFNIKQDNLDILGSSISISKIGIAIKNNVINRVTQKFGITW